MKKRERYGRRARMRDGRKPRKGERKNIRRKVSRSHGIKNNITFTMGKQCGLKFETALSSMPKIMAFTMFDGSDF